MTVTVWNGDSLLINAERKTYTPKKERVRPEMIYYFPGNVEGGNLRWKMCLSRKH